MAIKKKLYSSETITTLLFKENNKIANPISP